MFFSFHSYRCLNSSQSVTIQCFSVSGTFYWVKELKEERCMRLQPLVLEDQPKLQGLQTTKLYLLLLTLWTFTQNRHLPVGSNMKYGMFVSLNHSRNDFSSSAALHAAVVFDGVTDTHYPQIMLVPHLLILALCVYKGCFFSVFGSQILKLLPCFWEFKSWSWNTVSHCSHMTINVTQSTRKEQPMQFRYLPI